MQSKGPYALRARSAKRRRVEVFYGGDNSSDSSSGEGSLLNDNPNIGEIYWLDISGSGKYQFPPSVRKAIRRWMLTKDIVNRECGNKAFDDAFSELCGELGFLDEEQPEAFRELCLLKLLGFIRNEGVRLRGSAYVIDDATGERRWKHWTALWMENDWDGDPKPPKIVPAQPSAGKQIYISQQLAKVEEDLRSLVPFLSSENVEKLLNCHISLCKGRVGPRVERLLGVWTEAGLEERGGKGEKRSGPVGMMFDGYRRSLGSTQLIREERGGHGGSPEVMHEEPVLHSEAIGKLTEADNDAHSPTPALPPIHTTGGGFYANFKTTQRL